MCVQTPLLARPLRLAVTPSGTRMQLAVIWLRRLNGDHADPPGNIVSISSAEVLASKSTMLDHQRLQRRQRFAASLARIHPLVPRGSSGSCHCGFAFIRGVRNHQSISSGRREAQFTQANTWFAEWCDPSCITCVTRADSRGFASRT